MPKPISPEQLETLQANGVVVPGFEVAATPDTAMEAGLLVRTLGSVGLPHAEIIDQIEDPAKPDGSSVEVVTSETFKEQFNKVHDSATKLMQLVGETVPDRLSSEFQTKLAEMGRTFAVYEQLGLEPDVVLTPTGRALTFWENVARKLQDSPLNPQSGNQKLLRDGGLYVTDNVKAAWTSLVDRPNEAPGWDLSVISGKNKPEVVNVTTYGYADNDNQNPNPELNELLRKLSLPEVPERTGRKSQRPALTQPNPHPYVDTYLMNQLTRIIQAKDPVDTNTWSWLKGALADGDVPAGDWFPVDGQVNLDWFSADYLHDSIGVRPSGRG